MAAPDTKALYLSCTYLRCVPIACLPACCLLEPQCTCWAGLTQRLLSAVATFAAAALASACATSAFAATSASSARASAVASTAFTSASAAAAFAPAFAAAGASAKAAAIASAEAAAFAAAEAAAAACEQLQRGRGIAEQQRVHRVRARILQQSARHVLRCMPDRLKHNERYDGCKPRLDRIVLAFTGVLRLWRS